MNYITENEKKWIDEMWEKLDKKLEKVSVRSREKLPFWNTDGIHDDMTEKNICCWTNGFWPGLMWLMYSGTGKETYRQTAERGEELLDKALARPDLLSHDVGFMWRLASGADLELTGSEQAKLRQIYAADILMGRYNAVGEFFRAWNHGETKAQKAGWTIIDCMMNLPLLYWASRETEDPRFKFAAMKHADNTMKNHIRPDGSAKHIVIHDPFTGEILDDMGGQGYEKGSSWSRGQAWAIYGFVLSYIHTGKQEYLDTAKRVAHYFISCVCDDWLPKCDFRSPAEPVIYDSSAGACAACGLLEIAKAVPEHEKRMYVNAAMKILKAMENSFADWSEDTDFIFSHASGAYENDRHMNIIYTDYYFAEAIYKCKDFEPLFW